MIKAIIFDMDGVISDTQSIAAQVESDMLGKIGISATPQELVKKYAGVKDSTQFTEMFREANISLDVNEFVKHKVEKVAEEALKHDIEIPGVKKLISLLYSKNYILVVASASPKDFVNTILNKLNIRSKFTAVTSGDEVSEGKPNPEIFILAAKKLQINPENCLVIEDATNGVKAAKAAGMKCIAITTTHAKADLQEADKIIDSFDQLSLQDLQSL